MRAVRVGVVWLFVGCVGPATQPGAAPTPASFVPTAPQEHARIDLAAMRRLGVFDELDVGILRMAKNAAEQRIGLPFANVDRATLAQQANGDVLVVEGNGDVTGWRREGWSVVSFGTQTAWQRGDTLRLMFGTTAFVDGSAEHLRPLLDGPADGSAPTAMHELANARTDACVVLVLDAAASEVRNRLQAMVGVEAAWPAGAEPTFVCQRLWAHGDPDDPKLAAEMVVRHGASAGVEVTDKAIVAMLDGLRREPRLRLFRPVLQRIEQERAGLDLVVRVDLGRARDAAAVAMLAASVLVPDLPSKDGSPR